MDVAAHAGHQVEAAASAEPARGGALADLRVLEIADPRAAYCGKLLADAGADVVLVEPPAGSALRRSPPFKGDLPHPDGSLPFAYLNACKRGITLDLDVASGRAIFRELARRADVVVEGGAPGRLAAWDLGLASLQDGNPGLVLVSITPFGQTGPHSAWRATDEVAYAAGGIMYLSGAEDGPPVLAPGAQGMLVAGAHAAFGALAALRARRLTGRGQAVDVAIQESLAAQENVISTYTGLGRSARRSGSQHRVAAPGRIYPCRDGFVHFFVSPVQQGAWDRLVAWAGSPGLAEARWRDPAYRRAHVAELDGLMRAWTQTLTRQEIFDGAQARKVPCAPVNTMADFAADPQVQARGFFRAGHHPHLGDYTFPASVFHASPLAAAAWRPAPRLGEHNADVLCGELRYERHWLPRLRQAGVI